MRLVRTDPAPPGDAVRALAVVGFALLLAARFVPWHLLPPTCGFRAAFGLPCPSCGMTRAFVGITHFDPGAALHVSPLGSLLALGAVAAVVYAVLRYTVMPRGFALQTSRTERRVLWVTGGVLVAANWAYLLVTGAAT